MRDSTLQQEMESQRNLEEDLSSRASTTLAHSLCKRQGTCGSHGPATKIRTVSDTRGLQIRKRARQNKQSVELEESHENFHALKDEIFVGQFIQRKAPALYYLQLTTCTQQMSCCLTALHREDKAKQLSRLYNQRRNHLSERSSILRAGAEPPQCLILKERLSV